MAVSVAARVDAPSLGSQSGAQGATTHPFQHAGKARGTT